jgi:hypothetical protein
LGLEPHFDGVERVFDVFASYAGDLWVLMGVLGGGRGKGSGTYRAVEDIFCSVHECFFASYSESRRRFGSEVCGRCCGHLSGFLGEVWRRLFRDRRGRDENECWIPTSVFEQVQHAYNECPYSLSLTGGGLVGILKPGNRSLSSMFHNALPLGR